MEKLRQQRYHHRRRRCRRRRRGFRFHPDGFGYQKDILYIFISLD